jgi:hypothetical protein
MLITVVAATTAINPDLGLLSHTSDLLKVIAPVYGALAGLVVWAFKRLEKADEAVVRTLEELVKEEDAVHDKLFDLLRKHDERMAELHELGEKIKIHHKKQHGEEI